MSQSFGDDSTRHRARWPAASIALVLVALLMRPAQSASAQARVTPMYPKGWTVVAGPEGALLVGAVGWLYTLQPGDTTYRSFPADAPLHACWGYWAYFPAGGTIDRIHDAGPCTVTPTAGQWVLAGNPSTLNGAIVTGADTVLSNAPGWALQPPYVPVGYGVWVSGAGPVTITPELHHRFGCSPENLADAWQRQGGTGDVAAVIRPLPGQATMAPGDALYFCLGDFVIEPGEPYHDPYGPLVRFIRNASDVTTRVDVAAGQNYAGLPGSDVVTITGPEGRRLVALTDEQYCQTGPPNILVCRHPSDQRLRRVTIVFSTE